MTSKIAIVGEAWGVEEERERAPFIGPSGRELTRMLSDAGINRVDCFLTNVFNLHPPGNNLDALCTNKGDAAPGLPALKAGKYLCREYVPELHRLQRELSDLRPNVVVALGNTAAWALLHNTGVSKIRGTASLSVSPAGLKVIPTFHPAAVLRQWELRAVTVLDLMKAKRQSEFPEIRRPQRFIYTEPTLADLEEFFSAKLLRAPRIACDIETRGDQITCIGFAPSAREALVIPFWDDRKPGGSYWSADDEPLAWHFVAKTLALPVQWVFQNGLYDVHFLWRQYGIKINFSRGIEDTMLLHHALYPESQKGLGFMGSVYTDEPAWKIMRPRGKAMTKRDE